MFVFFMLAGAALDMQGLGSTLFPIGLFLYLVGHVFAIIGLWKACYARQPRVALRWPILIPLGGAVGTYLYFVLTGSDMTAVLMGPVVIYCVVEGVAVWRAWARVGRTYDESTQRQLFAACKCAVVIIG